MGILNVTPDSFSDGGRFLEPEKAADHGLQLLEEGADILDIGGESSRPGSDPVSATEELNRTIPVIQALRARTQALLSIDTTKSLVAQAALDAGVDIINDISAGNFDPGMLPLAAHYQVPIILMHMQGKPKSMQEKPSYANLLEEIKQFLRDKIAAAQEAGIPPERIILDPGIGFGKTYRDNLTLIKNLDHFSDLNQPIQIGISRKAFIGKILDLPPEERVEGTIAAALLSIIHGAHILRVHDVQAVKRAVLVAESILHEDIHFSDGEGRRSYAP